MMDAKTGKVIANMPICSMTDATWFDPGTKMVFSSCSGGGGGKEVILCLALNRGHPLP
jgi:hypothetical protein